jgi:hypothetical protein
VQCKWASKSGDVVVIRVKGSWHSPGRGYVRNTYGPDEIDAIAAYCGEREECYLLPIEKFQYASHVHLRLAPAKNSQRAALHWAADYQLGAVAQLEERRLGMAEATGSSPVSSIGRLLTGIGKPMLFLARSDRWHGSFTVRSAAGNQTFTVSITARRAGASASCPGRKTVGTSPTSVWILRLVSAASLGKNSAPNISSRPAA